MSVDVMVGRQPILDASQRTVGYELLFRGKRGSHGPHDLTANVVVDAVAELGLDRLVGDRPAFLNVTRDFLLAFDPLPFPPDRVVLELLEDQEVDDALIERLDRLRAEGFTLALDDFRYAPHLEPLLGRAKIVKLDIMMLSDAELVEHVERLSGRGLQLLAEKVETQEDFARCQEIGLTLFQGYFFAKPALVRTSGMPANKVASLDTLSALLRSEGSFEALEKVIDSDIGLVYKLLRWANSGLAGRGVPVESVHDALVRLGERQVRQWALLATLASGGVGAPGELIRAALVRGRACELIARDRDAKLRASAYTVGLLSALDALFEAPLPELLERLGLDDALTMAIVDHRGELGKTLEQALRLETESPEEAEVGSVDLAAVLGEVDALERSVG